MLEIVLAVESLTVYRETYAAVQDVSFSLVAGTDMAIVGPNGAGKTTLVLAILGLLPRQAGEVFILGQPMSRRGYLAPAIRQQIAYLPQNFLFDRRIPMTVEELVGLGWDRLGFQVPWADHRKRHHAICAALARVDAAYLRHQLISGLTGGMLGSFTILRQLSFFSDALGHSALLGISIGLLIGINPTVVLLPFAVLFALGVTYLLERTRLWTDALLNIIYSSSLAIAIITLSFVGQYKGGLNNLLFGDILAVQELDLVFSAVLLLICIGFIGLTLRTQMLLTFHESLAIARGVSVLAHRTAFIVLLSLVVGISIKAIGVLLVSAFVVIPACAARLLSRQK